MKDKEKAAILSYAGCGIIFIGCVILAIFQPLQTQLGTQGQWAMIGVIMTLGLWIFRPFHLPFSAGAFFFVAFMLIIGIPEELVLSGYAHSAIWTLAAALFFGFVLKKTGLGERIAFFVLRLFKPSFGSLLLVWILIGIVLSLLTPSVTVRVAIMIPIALNCCRICGLKPGSIDNSLILLTVFLIAIVPGAGWFTGSLSGPIIQGSFENVEALKGMVTPGSYFRAAFIPLEIATVLTIAGSIIFLRPKGKISPEAAEAIKKTECGEISRDEGITAAILVTAFILFIVGERIGLSTLTVCFGAVFLFFVFGIIKPSEIGTGISWDLIVFVGAAVGLGTICMKTGLIDWFASILIPLLKPIAGNTFLFVAVFTAVLFLWHFVDVPSFFPTIIILPSIFPAIQEEYGIDPLVFIPIISLSCCAFFMSYENQWVIMSESMAQGRGWSGKHRVIYATIFFAASIIAILISVPIFKSWGMLP